MLDISLEVFGLCIITPIVFISIVLLWDFMRFSLLKEGCEVKSDPVFDDRAAEYFYTGTTRIISVRKEGWRTVEIGLETGETLTFKQLWNSLKYGL